MVITSKSNQSVKLVGLLKQKKYRDERGLYIVEGEKMVFDAINCGQEIVEIFALEKYSDRNFMGIKCNFVTEQVFKFMSGEVTPQGILAVCKIPERGAIGRLTHSLLLDRVQDPGNVGTIVRLAAACGIRHIFSIDSADAYSQKAVRSSMSGIYKVDIIKTSESEIVDILKDEKVPLICADMQGENLFQFTPPEKFCLCLGNEGQGVSDFLIDNADYKVAIPMEKGVESLNVSVAAGVTLYTLLNA